MESRTVKISLVAAAALLVTTGCIARGLRREKGPSVEQTREVAAYTAIQTGGGIDVVLSDELKAGQIVVVASEKMQDQILTEVEGGELNIRLRPSLLGWFGPGPMKVIVPNTGTLTRLRASGGSDIWADQVMLRGSSLEIGCSGGSDFKGKVTVDELDVACSGSSDFKSEVTATTCRFEASGGSDLALSGSAKECQVDLSGGSDMDAKRFEVGDYKLSASGGSDATVLCTGHLIASASGGSDVRYAGDCQTTISDDISSSVKRRH